MKKLFTFILCIIIGLDIIDNMYLNNGIQNMIKNYFKSNTYSLVMNKDALNNKYKYNDFSDTVSSTDNFTVKNKDELLNVYYTFLNNGLDNFTYYCDKNYKSCINDIKEISEDANVFSYVNQLVHPYNSFKEINSKYNKITRRVDIDIKKKYSKTDIEKIDNKMNEIIDELNINNYSNIEDKIRVFHDYLASTNVYDKDKESNTSKYNSDTAIGTLFEGHSICSGYSDTLAIYLNKLGLDNIKVISDKHAWNAVKLNNAWYHIDLTWDDPIVKNGPDTITHNYFLITTHDLFVKDSIQHNYDRKLYSFLTK